jgi:hypothetical protein
MGETRHSAVIERTLNPSWYETLSIPVCLPALHYAPEVAIGIYDKDAFTEGECVGLWVLCVFIFRGRVHGILMSVMLP